MTDTAFDSLTMDQQWLVSELLSAGARFVVFGGYAVRAHGHLRGTRDLDLVIDPADGNLLRVRAALNVVNACSVDEAIEGLRSGTGVVDSCGCQLFPKAGAFSFVDIAKEAMRVPFGDQTILVISATQLITEKRYWRERRRDKATTDSADVDYLLERERTD